MVNIKITPDDACKFAMFQRVAFVLDPELHGMITAIVFRAHGVSYFVTRSDLETSEHIAEELTAREVAT